jgi:NAD(P)H-dependent FMN reductase
MIHILVGTNRPHSRSAQVAEFIKPFYEKQGEEVTVLNLVDLGLDQVPSGSYGERDKPAAMAKAIEELLHSDGLVVVVPEYNGSYPGALKFFIDHWRYPESFEHRPVAFIGLGGRFGGLRPVEHLQQVFGYRNGFIYPDRVFLTNIFGVLKDGQITDTLMADLLMTQAQGFCRFIKALKSENLHGGLKKQEN